MTVKGYKAFDQNMQCRGFQYEVGKTYTLENPEDLKLCSTGFHFCRNPVNLPVYYDLGDSRFAEIEAIGNVIDSKDQCKSVTDSIKIVRECSYNEIVGLCNVGGYNTGVKNVGDYNTGDVNLGRGNTGSANIGARNTGYYNDGDWNTGDDNIGRLNTGHGNTGSYNVGNDNIGSSNVGDNNIGFFNLGSFNRINGGFGCFLTDESQQKIWFFNKPSDWTYHDWYHSRARSILRGCNTKLKERIMWKSYEYMTEKEREANPNCKTIGGCLTKRVRNCILPQDLWDNLNEDDKKEIMSLPNFDANIFYECTGIRVKEGKE